MIRPATLADLDVMLRGYVETVKIQGEEEFLTRSVVDGLRDDIGKWIADDEHQVRVIDDADGRAVGFIVFVFSQQVPYIPQKATWWHRYLWVSLIWVDASVRGKGVAAQLMASAEEHARHAGPVDFVYDDVYECNAASCKFHEKRGFQHFGNVVRRDLKLDELRQSVAEQRAALPDVELRPFDGSREADVAAIRRGLVDIYAVEGAEGVEYGADDAAQDREVERFKTQFGAHTTMACVAGAIVGWIVCSEQSDTPYGCNYGEYWFKYADLSYVWVDAKERSRGLSRLLLDHALVAVNNVTAISSYAKNNPASERWHEKNGFKLYVRIFRLPLQTRHRD